MQNTYRLALLTALKLVGWIVIIIMILVNSRKCNAYFKKTSQYKLRFRNCLIYSYSYYKIILKTILYWLIKYKFGLCLKKVY